MTKVLAVASNTMREAVRDRILYLLLFFAVLMMATSGLLSQLALGDPEKIVLDIGLASISFFSVLIAVFMGIGLISKEIERRTIYAVVSKPLGRGAFVVGKFLGLLGTIAVIQVVMTLVFVVTLKAWGTVLTAGCAFAIALSFVEAAVMLAVALFFSALSSPMLASMFTLATYAVGHWVDSIGVLAQRLAPGPTRTLFTVLYLGFPNLERLNLKGQVVFADPASAAHLPLQSAMAAGYGIFYSIAIVSLAVLAYRRKDFV